MEDKADKGAAAADKGTAAAAADKCAGAEASAAAEAGADEQSFVAQARLASALTLDDAARITGMGASDYARLESRPLQLSVGELRSLCRELNTDGQHILRAWIDGFFGL